MKDLMIWKNEGLISATDGADDLVYPREFHALGGDALVATQPDAALSPPDRRFESLSALASRVERDPILPVRALVFHCSRCGSTLLARLFATEGSSRVFAEPPVLGKFFWSHSERLARGEMRRELKAFVQAFGLQPTSAEHGLVIKLPSWALLFLEPLRACFPDAPFAYLLRDPVPVVASLCAYEPGFLRPENRAVLARAFGAEAKPAEGLPPAEWYAWYVDQNLRLALHHESKFAVVIDHARFAEESVRWVAAITSAPFTANRPDIAQLLSRHAKSPSLPYQPQAIAAAAGRAPPVASSANEAYQLWGQRIAARR